MFHIKEIVKEYLETKDTDYSILITGKWGSGKTYYIKNVLMKTFEDKKSIYISLNGLTTLDNISTKILISYFNINKNVNMGHDVIKTLLEIGDSVKSVKEFKNIVLGIGKTVQKILTKKLDLSKSIIFIDDLERISSSLEIIDVLGFINVNFIEHNKNKVILICDEEKLEKGHKLGDNNNYSIVKEKIINRSIKFRQNISEFIPQYLSNRYRSIDSSYYEYINNKKDIIINILLRAKEENIRTYNFIFDTLYNLFKRIDINQHKKYLDSLLLFVITISIEFKNGQLNSSDYCNYKGLDNLYRNMSSLRIERSLAERRDEKPESKKEIVFMELFNRKYIENSIINWQFYKSAYEYIL